MLALHFEIMLQILLILQKKVVRAGKIPSSLNLALILSKA